MASGRRQPAKSKRAAQNRAQRAALAARRDAATSARTTAGTASAAGSTRGGLLGGLRRGGGLRATAAAGRASQPVGYRAALSGLLMALAGVLFTFTFSVPVDADDEPFTSSSLTATWAGQALDVALGSPEASAAEVAEQVEDWTPGRGETPLALALWPLSLTLALPALAAAIAFRAVSKRASSKVVSRALFATLFGALLSQIPVFFLPSVVALGVAVFQLRKYESATAAASGAAAADPGVIEAHVVEDEPLEPEPEPLEPEPEVVDVDEPSPADTSDERQP